MSEKHKGKRGHLRIGDDWNAITIIALSQNNPLKAIAEFVENSIDAKARQVTIIRGKEHDQQYLKVIDDGEGIPCGDDGIPDFKYVATHICDSLKRRLKQEGVRTIQGEFGIGLLSFWTVGHELLMISPGRDGKMYQMEMKKGMPGYVVISRPHLLPVKGTQLIISHLLAGIRNLNGEKIQRYLASELRDRIRHSGVKIRVIDRTSRLDLNVEPRQYEGRLIHDLPQINTPLGDVYVELYLSERNPENCISLFRSGTRVLPDITVLDYFQCEPWTSGYFQGVIDAPFLHLTPGTRDGIIHDEHFAAFSDSLINLKDRLNAIVLEQSKSEEERMSKSILRSVQKAFLDAMLNLPREEYDWFDMPEKGIARISSSEGPENSFILEGEPHGKIKEAGQKQFFEIAGPLFSARIQPGSAILPINKTKNLHAVGLDRSRRRIEQNLSYEWVIIEGKGQLDKKDAEFVTYSAPDEPALCKLKVIVRQLETVCEAECIITIVDSLLKVPAENGEFFKKGMPSYTLESAAGQMWRSRYDEKRNIIIINSGHRDFIYAGKERMRKLRYISRLFAKELVLHNFIGEPSEQLLEHFLELSMYTEDNLK